MKDFDNPGPISGFRAYGPIVCLLFLFVPSWAHAAETFGARYDKLMAKQEWKKAQSVLENWEKAAPEDPDLWAAQGDWWHQDAHRQETDELFYASSESAATCVEKALEALPERLDLWFALCELDLDLNDLGAFYDNASSVARRAGTARWTWKAGIPPPGKPEVLVADQAESWCWELYRDGTDGNFTVARRLAALTARLFPTHPGAERYLGRDSLDQGKWAEAKNHLLKSMSLDEDDSETLLDLGRAYWELEKDEAAKDCYRRVIALNNDPDAVARARKALERAETEY